MAVSDFDDTAINFRAVYMRKNSFRFKKFTIEQDNCAMKVGTDGCLLGAWADITNCKRILDAGCGSGLITIMMAQRSTAHITGVEIDESAAEQARKNAEQSPWDSRIKIVTGDVRNYLSEEKFDAMVSNPPFFSDSLKCPNKERTMARHDATLTCSDLFKAASSLLTDNGTLSLVIPSAALDNWCDEAIFKGFSLRRICTVQTLPHKPAKRILIEFIKGQCYTPCTKNLILEETPGRYSLDTCNLLRDFYLKIE